MKIFFSLILMAVFTVVNASSVIGLVQKVNGNVKVKNEGSFKKSKLRDGLEIKSGDLITTSKKGTAILKLVDGSILALDVSSSIHFKTPSDAEQTVGKIFYKITSRDAKNSLKIKTPFAIIGIKGTTFIIDAKKDGSVLLKEGLIGLTSIKEEFELYRKKVQEEFNSFISNQQSEFEKYKNEQNKYAVAELRKEFDLEAGNRISFDGNKVNEDAWNEEDDAEFERFKKMLELK